MGKFPTRRERLERIAGRSLEPGPPNSSPSPVSIPTRPPRHVPDTSMSEINRSLNRVTRKQRKDRLWQYWRDQPRDAKERMEQIGIEYCNMPAYVDGSDDKWRWEGFEFGYIGMAAPMSMLSDLRRHPLWLESWLDGWDKGHAQYERYQKRQRDKAKARRR